MQARDPRFAALSAGLLRRLVVDTSRFQAREPVDWGSRAALSSQAGLRLIWNKRSRLLLECAAAETRSQSPQHPCGSATQGLRAAG